MIKRCIIAENRKLHASPVWVMFFILPVISAGYGTFNYLQNTAILTNDWYSLWTQHTLFYSLFFFPAMVAVYAAYLWRLEHRGHNWNLIMAVPVPQFYLFLAKFAVVVKMVLLTQCFTYALYLACGKLFVHFDGWPPAQTFYYLMRGVAGGLAVVALQLLLSMLIRSFAVPVFISLFGGVSGMLAASQGMSYFWPYALMQAGMNSNKAEDVLSGGYAAFALACALWLAAIFCAAALLLKKCDVKA